MSEMVILMRCQAPWIRPRRTTTVGASVLVRVSCADISLSHLLGTGRVLRPSGTRFARTARSAAGVEIPHLPGGAGKGGITHTSDQAGAEGQPGEVGAAPASGLVPDPVQVRADRA